MNLCFVGVVLAQAPSAPRKLIIDQGNLGPGGSNLQSILMAPEATVDVVRAISVSQLETLFVKPISSKRE